MHECCISAHTRDIVIGMSVAADLRTQRALGGLSVRQLAALAGVAPSTVTRTEAGTMTPTIDVLEALYSNLGQTVTFQPKSDPAASAAARRATGPYEGQADQRAIELLDRWARIGLTRDSQVVPGREQELLFLASRLDRINYRAGLSRYMPKRDWTEPAEAFYNTPELGWALTGGAAANCLVNVGGGQPQVFYVSDVDAAVEAAGLAPVPAGYSGPSIALIPFNGIWDSGTVTLEDGLRIADRTQIVIDCYTLGGAGQTQADALLGVWV